MGTWPRRALGVTLGAFALVGVASPADASSETDVAPARDVMLADIGEEWTLTDEETVLSESFTRTFAGPDGQVLLLNGLPVTMPPGVNVLFDGFVSAETSFTADPEPSLELAVWFEEREPGEVDLTSLLFASREHIFSIFLLADDGSERDLRPFVLGLARRQIEAAGGPPSSTPTSLERDVDDRELLRWLPDAPPPGLPIDPNGATFVGPGAEELEMFASNDVTEFLTRRSKTVTRVWASSTMSAAVGITQYPYDIFAASALYIQDKQLPPIGTGPIAGLSDAVTFRQPDESQVGIVFRRGDVLVTVLALYEGADAEAPAISVVTALAQDTAAELPEGASEPYDLTPPSRFVGLTLTIVFVAAAVAGSRTIAWARARSARRGWFSDEPSVPLPPPGSPPTHVIELDGDAGALRRRGRTLFAIQVVIVTVGVVALSGDFATPGMVMAAAALISGLAVTRWWMRRELAWLGPAAPPRALVLPRLPGALCGLAAFAVLGAGVAYLLKGIRYLALPMTLAQLRWSDLLGISPRAVGIAFAAAGLVATVLGGTLYRLARAMSRADAKRVLDADRRPPALYLRSFADDALALPVTASARRPLFELFSIRGADPFEECVAWELNSYAPVVAVGRPGGTLHTLGAAREHLAQDKWRDEISDRMGDAGLIVLAPGETAGLEWELGEIVRGGHLGKSVFVFPPLPPSDLRRRWSHTAFLLRAAGAAVGEPAAKAAEVHTLRIGHDGAISVTIASTRDEATYRTAVDRALGDHAGAAARHPAALAAGTSGVT